MSSTATAPATQPRWKVIEGDSLAAKASKLAEALELDPRPLMDRPLEWHRPAVGCFWRTRCGEFSITGYRDGTETGVELFRSGRSMGRHLRLRRRSSTHTCRFTPVSVPAGLRACGE